MLTFKWRHFQEDLILIAVHWYVDYKFSCREIEELMSERGVTVDHSTINRWVLRYAPLLKKEFKKKRAEGIGNTWHVEESHVKVKGVWCYLYRAIDEKDNTLDFVLSQKRSTATARSFFRESLDELIEANIPT